jgi:uncharacterized protein (DUF736 family)
MAYEQKPNTGAFFINKKQTGNQPNLRGSVHVDKVLLENLIHQSKGQLVEIAIAGWNQKSKAGEPYISLAVSEPYKKEEQPQTEERQPWEV